MQEKNKKQDAGIEQLRFSFKFNLKVQQKRSRKENNEYILALKKKEQ